MVLQLDRATIDSVVVRRGLKPVRPTPEFFIILNKNTIVNDSQSRRLEQFAIVVEPRSTKRDVVGLPLAGWPRGVRERGILAVKSPGLAVGVGIGLVRVDHLNFKHAHQEDAAVAAILSLAGGRFGRGPLNVQLNVAESRFGLDRSGPRCDFHEPIAHLPPRRFSAGRLPGIEVGSVEQDDGVFRHGAGDAGGPPTGSTSGGLGRLMSCCNQRM